IEERYAIQQRQVTRHRIQHFGIRPVHLCSDRGDYALGNFRPETGASEVEKAGVTISSWAVQIGEEITKTGLVVIARQVPQVRILRIRLKPSPVEQAREITLRAFQKNPILFGQQIQVEIVDLLDARLGNPVHAAVERTKAAVIIGRQQAAEASRPLDQGDTRIRKLATQQERSGQAGDPSADDNDVALQEDLQSAAICWLPCDYVDRMAQVRVFRSQPFQAAHLILADDALAQHLVHVEVRERLHHQTATREDLRAAALDIAVKGDPVIAPPVAVRQLAGCNLRQLADHPDRPAELTRERPDIRHDPDDPSRLRLEPAPGAPDQLAWIDDVLENEAHHDEIELPIGLIILEQGLDELDVALDRLLRGSNELRGGFDDDV